MGPKRPIQGRLEPDDPPDLGRLLVRALSGANPLAALLYFVQVELIGSAIAIGDSADFVVHPAHAFALGLLFLPSMLVPFREELHDQARGHYLLIISAWNAAREGPRPRFC
jgi:hypothetical protein